VIEKKRNSNLVRCSFRFLPFFCSSVKTRERREENAVAKRRKEEGKKNKMRASSNKNTGKPRPPVATSDAGNTNTNGRRGRGFGGGKQKVTAQKYAFIVLFSLLFFTVLSPYVRPTRESFYEKCVRERLGSKGKGKGGLMSNALALVARSIVPEGEQCSKNMLYDDYFLFSTMVVNERVYLGVLPSVWVPIPWPVSLVLAKTVLAFARANRKVLKVYFAGCVGFVLMKVLKKIMMVVKLAFAVIALKLFSGESFGWVLITLASHGAFAYLVLFERFPKLKKIVFPRRGGGGKRHDG
jgi:hypothetical protein